MASHDDSFISYQQYYEDVEDILNEAFNWEAHIPNSKSSDWGVIEHLIKTKSMCVVRFDTSKSIREYLMTKKEYALVMICSAKRLIASRIGFSNNPAYQYMSHNSIMEDQYEQYVSLMINHYFLCEKLNRIRKKRKIEGDTLKLQLHSGEQS